MRSRQFLLIFHLVLIVAVFAPTTTISVLYKAMRKKTISAFLCFASFDMFRFSYLNKIRKKFDTFIFAKIPRNKYGKNHETRFTRSNTEISKLTQSKNTLKTVLSSLEAEIFHFLCFYIHSC